MRTFLKSKIKTIVTDTNKDYEGSITLDSEVLKKADILPSEIVQVENLNTGAIFETYVIEGKGVCLNGAAARLVIVGDPIEIWTKRLE